MDNLSSHKTAALEKIEATDAEVRFLPPYRSNHNLIEQIFSKVEAHLCRLAVRIERKLYNAIAQAIENVTSIDCLNCFRNSGYVARKK